MSLIPGHRGEPVVLLRGDAPGWSAQQCCLVFCLAWECGPPIFSFLNWVMELVTGRVVEVGC